MRGNQVIILLITILVVLSAVLVGIHIYKLQAYNSNIKSLSLDINGYISQVFVYWKTPTAGGGAAMDNANVNIDDLAEFCGFAHIINADTKTEYYSVITENGEIRIKESKGNQIILQGLGCIMRKGMYPNIQYNVNLYTYMVTSNQSKAMSF